MKVVLAPALAVLSALAALQTVAQAHADTNGYFDCLTSHGVSGDTNTELTLGDEAYNTLRGRPRGQSDIEVRALRQKYHLTQQMASVIVECATTYPPV